MLCGLVALALIYTFIIFVIYILGWGTVVHHHKIFMLKIFFVVWVCYELLVLVIVK